MVLPTAVLLAVVPPLAVVLIAAEILLLASVSTALSGVFRAALYQYALEGEAVGPFDQSDLARQFHPKR